MPTTLNPTYANALNNNLVTGTAVSSGNRYLALTTDNAGTIETTDANYARIDITAKFGAPSSGVAATNTTTSTAAFATGATILGYAICTHISNAISTCYLMGGATTGAVVLAAGDVATIAVGDGTVSVLPG